MKNSILLGKYIYNFLNESQELKDYNVSVYPLIADEDVSYPFVVYSKTNIVPSYIKDGVVQDTVNITIHCVSDNYVESLEIANIIRKIFELRRYQDEQIYISYIAISDISESFEEDAYIQTINITAYVG